MKGQNQELNKLKEGYQRMEMSMEQIEGLKRKMEQAKAEKRRSQRRTVIKSFTAAAACLVLFVMLPNTSMGAAHAMSQIPFLGRLVEMVTFRDYKYESERQNADIQVPELVVGAVDEGTKDRNTTAAEDETKQKLERTVEEINAQVKELTDRIIGEFEENLKKGSEGYQDILVKSELIGVSQDYFTLKLFCYQGAGSGYQWNYFYTVDLNTGERLKLKELFREGADYITPVSEDIKRQMREQMAQDEMKKYWLDDPNHSYWEFPGITDETSFYINADGGLVICFDEGDVAPMYMGSLEFVISEEAVKDIRRQ